jgi:hypothetical protein
MSDLSGRSTIIVGARHARVTTHPVACFTKRQWLAGIYRGVAGMFILDDPVADALPLPDEYGGNDIPLIIQDKRVNDDDDPEFDLIATDGGLLETPQRLTRIQLSPGERAEIVSAFEPGERVVLRSFEPELGTNFFENRFAGGDDSFDLLQIRAAPTLTPSPELPERLAAPEHFTRTTLSACAASSSMASRSTARTWTLAGSTRSS